jgi:hypothetical protein
MALNLVGLEDMWLFVVLSLVQRITHLLNQPFSIMIFSYYAVVTL